MDKKLFKREILYKVTWMTLAGTNAEKIQSKTKEIMDIGNSWMDRRWKGKRIVEILE